MATAYIHIYVNTRKLQDNYKELTFLDDQAEEGREGEHLQHQLEFNSFSFPILFLYEYFIVLLLFLFFDFTTAGDLLKVQEHVEFIGVFF